MVDSKEFKVIHFTQEFSHSEIVEYLKDKENILYYTRTLKEGKEFHVIKNNNNAFFKLNILESELLKQYEKIDEFKNFIKDVRIKGNINFAILENIHPKIILKMKNDLNNLLKK